MRLIPLSKESLTNTALILGLGITLAVPHGVAIWPVLFSIAGLIMFSGSFGKPKNKLPEEIREARKTLSIVAGLAIVGPLSVDLIHSNKISLDPYIAIILLPSLAIVVYRNKVVSDTFFTGVALAAILAFGLACYEHFFKGISRAGGYMNPIPFGDICVLFSLALIVRASSAWQKRPKFAIFLIIGIVCSTYAGLLSGSKGGWLALTFGLIFGLWKFLTNLRMGRATTLAVVIVVAIGFSFAFPNTAKSRIIQAYNGAVTWLRTGEISDSSASVRFEMWKQGVLALQTSPLIGLSTDDMRAFREYGIEKGLLDEGLGRHVQSLHSEFINQLAFRGIIGFSISMATFFVPFYIFRQFRTHADPTIRDLSLIGLLLPLAFLEFGISISIWSTSSFRFVYISWIVLVLALMAVRLNQITLERERPPSDF
ncbi:MAG: O-antigen ligase family protein [Oceanospirillaceae bacterium]|nr:O-antigen ligase family protein [Oceanospirillaceae bacterium]